MSWQRAPAIPITLWFALIATAWAVTTPPFASPDEWAHYLRALSIAHGQVLGRPISDYPPGLTPAQREWVLQATRVVDVPEGFATDGYACHVFTPAKSAACNADVVGPAPAGERIIPNGTYQPAAYLAPAAVIRLGWGAKSALVFGRLANGLACALLLGLAARALTSGGRRALGGLLLAFTPMTVFLAGTLNPSGLEIFSSFALLAGLLAVARGDSSSRDGWLAASVGAFVLPLSRSLGGAYLPVLGALWLFAVGPVRAWRLARGAPRQSTVFAIAILAGFAANRTWERLYGPKVPADTHDLVPALASALTQVPGWLMQEVGNFQYIDTPLPQPIYAAWLAAVVVLLAAGLMSGDWAARRGIVASLAVALALPLALQVLVLRPSEWLVQGRHVIAVTAPGLLFAGEAVATAASAAARRVLVAAFLLVWAAGQLAGFWVSAQRSAVGVDGPAWFFSASEWQPRLGWVFWVLVVAAATAAAVVALWPNNGPGAAHHVSEHHEEGAQHG